MPGAEIVERGRGPALVLVPGLQGRWEWMEPVVAALARHFRVVTFTLAGDWGSRRAFDPGRGFDTFVEQVADALPRPGNEPAVLCGISYGGLIALRAAARHGARVSHLVLASALPPDYRPDRRYRFYRRAPVLLLPVFVIDSAWRVAPEVRRALPSLGDRLRFSLAQSLRVVRAPVWPRHMRRRMELLADESFEADIARIRMPTLVVTGEPGLDRTVPVALTRRYLEYIPGAEYAILERTGHLGTMTRPAAFAGIVCDFMAQHAAQPSAGEQVS
ncbi:MAG TPA: alpha/beta hydrolase [Vicinamibacterales bacterium]